MATIGFEDVTKRYDTGLAAVSNLTLDIADGEFLVLVGPSGCGKTTALRMIAGLEDLSSGRLLIGGKVANDLSPRERNIAMVFQSYALYPHLNVGENIAFGLRVRGAARGEIAAKVGAVAKILELEDFLGRKPGQLSGGQRQRVAMGRALVRSPNAFLMDEPLSNLDARLRGQMRAEIADLQKRTGVTTVYVTHDQVEAMTMGHRVAVMSGGVLQQLDTPRTLYDAPKNLFVAGFIGAPAMNFLDGVLGREDGTAVLRLGEHRFVLPAGAFAPTASHGPKQLVVGIRPEAFRLAGDGAASGALPGRIAFVEDLGATVLVHVDPLGATLLAPNETDRFAATRLRLRASLDGATRVKTGDAVRLAPDPAQVHLFDAATRLSLRANRIGPTLTPGTRE